MELFDRVDRITYNQFNLTNILRKVVPIKRLLNKIDVYYPYTIKEGERADTIAHDYYGDSSYAWLIYIVNDIFDPYYQWPLTNQQFFDYITDKYGDYYQTQVDIAYYKHDDKDYVVSEYTMLNWDSEQQFGWYPVTIYQDEQQKNESRREIRLISNRYIDYIDQQIQNMFA